MSLGNTSPSDRQWFIVGRWQEFEGEARANLLRIAAVGAFYIVHLVNFYWIINPLAEDKAFHQAATAVAAAWSLFALLILLCLRQRIFPASLKYISTGCDIVLLTALASLRLGPNSALVYGYFVILALSGLRFSLPLVWCSTLGCMLGYLSLVGMADKKWFDPEHVVPPVEQLLMQLSLALTGVVIGQVIRRVRAVAEDYARRLAAASATTPKETA